jgi:hypothetical protein
MSYSSADKQNKTSTRVPHKIDEATAHRNMGDVSRPHLVRPIVKWRGILDLDQTDLGVDYA